MSDLEHTADFGSGESTRDPTIRDEEVKITITDDQTPTIPVLLNLSDISTDGYLLIKKPETWIGREPECDIIIDDQRISRRHAYLQLHPPVGMGNVAEVSLIDNKSKNGTFVNGEDSQGPMLLRNGDRIMVGGTVFGFFYRTQLEVELEQRHRTLLRSRGYMPAETRMPVDISVAMSVVFPEDTFSPSTFAASICDISRRGARLSTTEIDRNLYSKMMKGKRHVRIDASASGHDSRIRLKGQLVWIHYEEGDQGRSCSMGICFDPLDKQCSAVVDYLAVRYSPGSGNQSPEPTRAD